MINRLLLINVAKRQKGASLLEYVLLAALIAIISLISIRTLGNKVTLELDDVSAAVAGDYSRIAGCGSGNSCSGSPPSPPPPPGG